MDTNDLINALAADTRRPAASLSHVWWVAAGRCRRASPRPSSSLTLGPRPDIAAAAETPRFLFKFVVAVTLAATAFGARPRSRRGRAMAGARRSPIWRPHRCSLVVAVVVELFLLPPDLWSARLIGDEQHRLPGLHSADRHWTARRLPRRPSPRRDDAAGFCRRRRRRAGGRHRGRLLRRPLHGRFAALRSDLVHARHRRACRASAPRPALRLGAVVARTP